MRNKCESCKKPFVWDDTVILVDDGIYHKDCLDVFPCSFFAMLDGEPLGETENDDGSSAYEYIEDLL